MTIDEVEHNKHNQHSDDLSTSSNQTPSQDRKPEQTREEALKERLLEKEAALMKTKKATKKLQKENKHIKESRTWKVFSPARKVRGLFGKLFQGAKAKRILEENNALKAYNQDLKKDLEHMRDALKTKQEHIDHLEMETDKVNASHLHQRTKQVKEDGDTISYIQNLVQRKESVTNNYNEALKKLGRHYRKDLADVQQIVYENLLKGFKKEDIPEFIVRFAETDHTLALQAASSFRASLTARARIRQLMNGKTPENLLDNKRQAYQLVDAFGIRRPWIKGKPYAMKEIPKEEAIVIKPVDGAGSRGVYLVYHENKIQDVKQAKLLTSWEALEKRMEEDLASGWVASDLWMIEEFIVKNKQEQTPAVDLKFYCFYGKVALILEITRFPEIKYCWWTPGGDRISTGKYEEDLFQGSGVTEEEIQTVEKLSAQLPIPFIRIDFLKTDQGMVFGEFTPKPGNYDEFDKETDQWMGDYHLDAEGRLAEDLINGKPFDVYHRWRSKL